MTEGGNIRVRSVEVEWEIERFFLLPKTSNYLLQSPRFMIADAEWSLRFYPNGETRNNCEWIGLYLGNEPSPSAITLTFTLGIKKADGSVLKSCDRTYTFKASGGVRGDYGFIRKSEFLSLKDIVDPNGTLRIYCAVSMHNDGSPSLPKGSLLLEIEGFKREIVGLKEKLSSKSKKIEADVANIKNMEQEIKKTDHVLSENFKELFRSQYEADTTVKVGDKEFLVHKAVLAIRSTVFRVMFETDMAEKNDGVVNIEDCEPCHFEDFLLFLYSGQFDSVNPNNALKLCLIADKYNVVQLKEACFETLKRKISLESVYDALYLATLYNEEELLNTATNFFMENKVKIICNPKWLSFLSEHTTIGNELIVKLVKH